MTPPPLGGAIVDPIVGPRDMVDKSYAKLHITLLYCKYKGFGSCDFREEYFSCISEYKHMADDDVPGAWPVWTHGHGWQDLWRGLLYIATHKLWVLQV